MNPRLLLAVVALMALLLGLAAWWRSDAAAHRQVTLDGPAHRTLEPVSDELERGPNAAESANSTPRAPVLPAPRSRPLGEARWTEQPKPSRMVGRVTSGLNGPALEGAVVVATRLGQTEDTGPTAFEARTDSAGRFKIENVGAGSWMVFCRRQGHKDNQRAIVVSPGGVDVPADFVLDRAIVETTISVRLRARGGGPFLASLAGQDLEIAMLLRPVFVETCPKPGADLPAGTSVIPIRARGVKEPRSDEWFRVTIEASKSGCCCALFGDRVLDVAPFAPGTTEIALAVAIEDLRRMTGGLQVSVVDDATGEALPGAHVWVHPALGAMRIVHTDNEGAAQVENLVVGQASVEIGANEHGRSKHKVEIRAGNPANLGVVRLPRSVSISGWVDPPEPVSQETREAIARLGREFDVTGPEVINVSAWRVVDGVAERNPISVSADAHGEFVFADLDPGIYLVSRERGYPSPPSVASVRERKVPKWEHADARFADVRGVRLPR